MAVHPTGRYGLMRIAAPTAAGVSIRFAKLADRDVFDPTTWPSSALVASAGNPGWWEFDLDAQGLGDGAYEYEFLLNGTPVADPYADEITRFGGYRGVFHMAGGVRLQRPFAWDPAVESGGGLPQNNCIVIYEMPLKWMSSAIDNPLVDLGTFDQTIFEHLAGLAALGVNCIELLPIEDSPQTLDWGYGTRFFFAPDIDIGTPVDARFFIKSCHERSIRVILDVVMAFFAPACPLGTLAPSWFSTPYVAGGRNPWGQTLFLYDTPAYGDYYAAREFLCEMGEFWVNEYHIDGFRIDDFPDIDNWEFVQEFHDRTTAASNAAFPTKPFFVVAEDSDRQFVITGPGALNGRKLVDAIWNFGFQGEIRALATGTLTTILGQPGRSARVQQFISNAGPWNGYNQAFDAGYADLACAVNYATSHDVANARRMMNVILGPILEQLGLGDGGVDNVKSVVDAPALALPTNPCAQQAVSDALDRVFGVFAIIMTSVGVPMFLAGEEFGDVHDTDYNAVDPKQQDPVQWQRANYPGNAALQARVAQLIQLRTSHPALQRNEIQFFYFHPTFNADGGTWIFAYCRTGGSALGSVGQIIVVANVCSQAFASFVLPAWPWGPSALTEVGALAGAPAYDPTTGGFSLSLDPFQVRVFRS